MLDEYMNDLKLLLVVIPQKASTLTGRSPLCLETEGVNGPVNWITSTSPDKGLELDSTDCNSLRVSQLFHFWFHSQAFPGS